MKRDLVIRNNDFDYQDERFADIQMLRYRVKDFDSLTLRNKLFVYCLTQATLFGRDITFDQFGEYNLRIRHLLEYVYSNYEGNRDDANFRALETYLKFGSLTESIITMVAISLYQNSVRNGSANNVTPMIFRICCQSSLIQTFCQKE